MTAEMSPKMEIKVKTVAESGIVLDQSMNPEQCLKTLSETNDDEKIVKNLLEELTAKVALEFENIALTEKDDSGVPDVDVKQELGASSVSTCAVPPEPAVTTGIGDNGNRTQSCVEFESSSASLPDGPVKKRGPGRPAKRKRRRSLDWSNRSLPNITLETSSVLHSESAEADEASGSYQTTVLCKKGRFSTLKTAECLRKQFEKFNKTSLDDLPKKRTVVRDRSRFSPLPSTQRQKLLPIRMIREASQQQEAPPVQTEAPVKPGKKRGRKSKAELAALAALASAAQSTEEPPRPKNNVDQSPSVIDGNKRKRGRPKKKPVVESDSDPVCNDDDLDVNAYRRSSEAGVNSETDQSASNINPISDSQICLQCSDFNAQISDILRPFLQQLDRKITFATDFMQQQCRKMNEVCDKFNSVGANELIVPHKC